MQMNYNDAKKYVRALSTVRYVEERPFMIAIVELQEVSSEEVARSGKPQRLMVAKGLSTCSPTDRWDTKRGQDVARGRAEAKLARRIMRQVAESTQPTQWPIPTVTVQCESAEIDSEGVYHMHGVLYYANNSRD